MDVVMDVAERVGDTAVLITGQCSLVEVQELPSGERQGTLVLPDGLRVGLTVYYPPSLVFYNNFQHPDGLTSYSVRFTAKPQAAA